MEKFNRQTLAVVLATYNEAGNLDRCLRAIKDIADEIIIVDGNSDDDTVKIAKNFGAKVIITTNKPIFHINKQMAMDEATSDWILQLDADEEVDEEMRDEIKKLLITESKYNAFWLKRKNYFLGGFLTKGGQYPDPVIRLYKKGQAKLPQKSVHEQMKVNGDIGQIGGHLLHYNAPTFARYINNANRYTSLTAQDLKDKKVIINRKNDWYYLLIKPAAVFGSLYFRHRGYKDGFRGFVFALFSGLHHGLAYMKLGDLERNKKL